MDRKEVYELIDNERAYQTDLENLRVRHDGKAHTVGDYIVMLHHYMNQLDEAWTMNAGDEEALRTMRKIAGIAVHCMEDHGGYPRRKKGPWSGK